MSKAIHVDVQMHCPPCSCLAHSNWIHEVQGELKKTWLFRILYLHSQTLKFVDRIFFVSEICEKMTSFLKFKYIFCNRNFLKSSFNMVFHFKFYENKFFGIQNIISWRWLVCWKMSQQSKVFPVPCFELTSTSCLFSNKWLCYYFMMK